MPVYDITLDRRHKLVIGDCEIVIERMPQGKQCRLGIVAPKTTPISRKEILSGINKGKCERAENRIKKVCLRQQKRTLTLKGNN